MKNLEHVILTTEKFLDEMPKSKRKKIGQFFTSKETAEYMANMFDVSKLPRTIHLLDPGAGTGILTAAFLDNLEKKDGEWDINITCYENNSDVLPVLKSNLDYIQKHTHLSIKYEIKNEDYLISQRDDFSGGFFGDCRSFKYDAIIGNPPYLRIPRNDPAAVGMSEVVHGAPNLYFLFVAMSLFNLKNNQEMVYIIPRSWTSGEYFKAFRKYILEVGKLEQIHLFVSRDKVFNQEKVLQETLILKLIKTNNTPQYINITSSQSNEDFKYLSSIEVKYDSVVSGENYYVLLPTTKEEVEIIDEINIYRRGLPDIGYKMRTGIVVDFRQKQELREGPGNHIVPLFYSQHIRNGRVEHFSSGKNFEWITDYKDSLIQPNTNYVFCKRFTSKEEPRRLQCGIYLSKDYPEYQYIGTQNKINYIGSINGKPLTLEEVYGIYVLFNSTLFDKYYRILNGSTQVNSTEINNIPVPNRENILLMGKLLLEQESLSTVICDDIISEVSYNE